MKEKFKRGDSARQDAHRTLRVAAMLFLLTSCGSVESRKAEADIETRQSLVEKHGSRGWIEFGTEAPKEARRAQIDEAVRLSRSAAAPIYDRMILASLKRSAETVNSPPPTATEPSDTAVSAVAGPTPQDQDAAASGSFQIKDASLRDLVLLVASATGLNVVLNLPLTERVSATLPKVNAQTALGSILAQHGYRLADRGGVHFVEEIPKEVSETVIIPIQSGLALDVANEINPMLSGDSRAFTDVGKRALVLTATQKEIARVRDYLGNVDRRPAQVIIEALIVEVARSNGQRRGGLANLDRIDSGNFNGHVNSNFLPTPPLGATANPFTIGLDNMTNAIELLLAADESIERLNVVHSPFAATVSGQQAILKVIESIPYIQATTNITSSTGTPNLTSTAEIQFEESGVTLDVTPTVGADEIVQVVVKPKVEELVGFVEGVPVIDTRESSNMVMVRNHETLVIGGLLRNVTRYERTQVPFLGDIPIIGELFKRVENSSERVELMIFITPHIIGYGFDRIGGFDHAGHWLGDEGQMGRVRKELEKRGLEVRDGEN